MATHPHATAISPSNPGLSPPGGGTAEPIDADATCLDCGDHGFLALFAFRGEAPGHGDSPELRWVKFSPGGEVMSRGYAEGP